MCGFCGVVSARGAVQEEVLIRMRDTLAHRGPNDAGTWLAPDGVAGLGHRRLSIVDLSTGHQPMSNEDGSVWLAFNGEIYNHLELRRKLERAGHVFRTTSDSEAIVHGYEEWGDGCLEYLRGEFAFAIWDVLRRRLLAARDRLGVKPFYYSPGAGVFVFGSELKAILAHPSVGRRLWLPAVAHYLTAYATMAPRTPFEDVLKLPAAHALSVDDEARVTTWRYWSPRRPYEKTPSEGEAREAIYGLFREATRDRMMSDVPFGVFLSGGVDSGANLGVMTELLERPVEAFTIGYDGGAEFNEFMEAEESARLFGAVHREIRIGRNEFWEALMEVPRFADEPNGNPECIPLYHLSRFTRASGVKVVQVGEGSDELFGYPGWPRLLRVHAQLRRWGQAVRPVLRVAHALAETTSRNHYSALFESHARGAGRIQVGMPYPPGVRRDLFGPALKTLDPDGEIDARIAAIAATAPEGEPLDDYQEMLWFELNHRLPEHILARVDRMTMSAGVEARVPFLDHRLVEFAFHLPVAMRFTTGAKSLFKEAIRGRVLPSRILDRPKRGFSTPVERWIAKDFAAEVRKIILGSPLVRDGILSEIGVRRLLDRHRAERERRSLGRSHPLYPLLLLCRWHQIHLEQAGG